MKSIIAQVTNLTNASSEYRAAWKEDGSNPKMVLFEGYTGAGKSTTLTSMLNRYGDAIYLRLTSVMTPSSFVRAVLRELEVDVPRRGVQDNLDIIAERLVERKKALFVDEADYLFRSNKMIDLVRDIHDIAKLPIVLVGMDGVGHKLNNNKQLDRRVTRRVRFQKMELPDGRILSDELCEVRLADDLILHCLEKTKGSIALMTVALARIEKFAKKQDWLEISLDAWGQCDVPLTLHTGGLS